MIKKYGLMPRLSTGITRLGCDPEFFFTTKDGKIKGAEKVLPKEGLLVNGGKIIIDGVQAELNPRPSSCREILASNISSCFLHLKAKMEETGETKTSFKGVVRVTKREMDSLSDNSKKFGCAPSENLYLNKKQAEIKVNPAVYKYRSAGGHIHIGHEDNSDTQKVLHDVNVIIPLLDLIVGNTCVLLDRDPKTKERRKNYGRAGEYRNPPHGGLEYRTLSNFWLRSYQLMSFVMGLSRFAVRVALCSNERTPLLRKKPYYQELLSKVKREDVITAINTNNLKLARKNFKVVEKFINNYVNTEKTNMSPLKPDTIPYFYHFVKRGLDYWFKEDPVKHWVRRTGVSGFGWERFLSLTVKADYDKYIESKKFG